jgi:hypothetical protein
MQRRVFREADWSRSNGLLLLVVCTLAVLATTGFSSSRARADAPVPPVFDGTMTFPMIDGPEGPEEYSWMVSLAEGQELESIDDQHAEVYYANGHHPALGISAELAHDASGSNVPTTLSVSDGDVITLTVHHRAGDPAADGAPFKYPIVGGQGWEGGFQTVIVSGPPDEQELREQRNERERKEGQGPASPTAEGRKRKGEIGGRPSTRLTPPDQGKQTTPALVIGRGRLPGGPVEIAGAGWSAPRYFETPGGGQLCVWIEYLAEKSTSSRCGPVAQTASGEETVYIESFSEGMGTNRPREAEFTGSLSSGVASVRVSFHRHGSRRVFHTNAVVALVSGGLRKSLQQPAPFGYFVIKVRGQLIARSLRIQAFDKEGHYVGASDDDSWEFLP